jgi:putative spermidine/putrescine transport system permease protein
MRARIWRLAVFLFVLGFALNLVGIVSHVAVSSFARRWFSTPLPPAWTTECTPTRGGSSSSPTCCP